MKRDKGGFGLWISIINRAARTYFQRELKHLGIGPGQQAYLLSLFPGEEITQEELAGRLVVDRANVTRALKTLVSRKYIRRKVSDHDRRAQLISLTPQGEKVQSEVQTIARKWIEHLQAAVSRQEWESLEGCLRTIANHVDPSKVM